VLSSTYLYPVVQTWDYKQFGTAMKLGISPKKGRQSRVLISANEVSSPELCHLVRVCAPDLLGQTRFEELLRQQDVCLALSYVVKYLGEYAGVALVAQRQPHLHLCMLAVRKELRSRGLGSLLLEAVLTSAQPHLLSLDVLSRNVRALAMYQYYGFKLQRSSFFWHRPLPLRWGCIYKGSVRALAPDIALNRTETPSLAWPAQSRSLLQKLPFLRGAVYMNLGVIRGVALFHSGLERIVVYRLAAADKLAARALFRYMHLVTPSASAIFLRWMQGEQLSSYLREMGFRCHSEYHILQSE